jgi:glycerophosphoryl diester phosphodiesterase
LALDDEKPPRLSRSTRVWLITTALLAAVGILILLAPRDGSEGPIARPAGFDLQGHRGARGLFPENTLEGFEATLALGVTTLEMDLAMSADRILVVHHDRRLDPERTRDSAGGWIAAPGPVIYDRAFKALQTYDVGQLRPDGRKAGRFAAQEGLDGVRIPSLFEVLSRTRDLSAGAARYNLEIKTSPLAPDEAPEPAVFAEALVSVLQRTGATESAVIQSFDWRALRHVQKIAPDIPTAYLTAEQSWLDNLVRGQPGGSPWTAGFDPNRYDGSVPRAVKAAGGAVWSPYFGDLRKADLAEARRLGLRVVVWTVNKAVDMASLIDLGVDGIITDYPGRLRAVMAEKGLPLPPAWPGKASE